MHPIIRNIYMDIEVDLSDEFDRNFERKSFFDQPWIQTKLTNPRGSLMMRSGNLRNSITSQIKGENIVWESSMPYASIHNEGGVITVTAKMKAFFWAMYYKSAGAISKTKGGKVAANQRNQRLSLEAEQWKAMALKKVGDKIKIEQRQFIGDHPEVRNSIEKQYQKSMKEIEEYMLNSLRQNK